MEQKFPLESDFGKYFLYNMYLTLVAGSSKNNKDIEVLHNSNIFNRCLNLNRYALRGFNCGEKKRIVDQYFSTNADDFAAFKGSVGDSCNNEISKYLSNYYHAESSFVDSTLYERLSTEALLESNFDGIMSCFINLENTVSP